MNDRRKAEVSAPDEHRYPDFIVTKEYRKFAEFCDACRRDNYIGVCYGLPGVGKTISAHYYTSAVRQQEYLQQTWENVPYTGAPVGYRSVMYTPEVVNSPKQIARRIEDRWFHWNYHIGLREGVDPKEKIRGLILIDEADRLKMAALEQVRDIYDRTDTAIVLIGMPGIEKRVARYAQLYSRVGFIHEFRSLSGTEFRMILDKKWAQLGGHLRPDDLTDEEAVATVIRITGGNFRLMQRLFAQVRRIMEINHLHVVTKDVVETAREGLILGTT